MLRRHLALPPLLFAMALGLSAAAPAHAGEEPKVEQGQYIDLSPIALPIVVDGKLVNYVFVSLRVNLTGAADAMKLRDKEPFLRDAMVKAAHRTPFTLNTDYTRVDEAKLKASLFQQAGAILGARNVSFVVVSSQTPKQRTGFPRPKG